MSSSMAGGLGAVNAAVRRGSKGVGALRLWNFLLWCLTCVSSGNGDGGPKGIPWARRWPHGQGGKDGPETAGADPEDGQVDAAGRDAGHRCAGWAQDGRWGQGQGRPDNPERRVGGPAG